MPYLTLKKGFSKDLDALKRNARKVYQRANEILMELQRDQDPMRHTAQKPEFRIV